MLLLHAADNHGSRMRTRRKKIDLMTVLLEALLECCTFTILGKILPRGLLNTNTEG